MPKDFGHAGVTTTLDIYTHVFDETRHTLDVRAQMAGYSMRAKKARSKAAEYSHCHMPAAIAKGGSRRRKERRFAGLLD